MEVSEEKSEEKKIPQPGGEEAKPQQKSAIELWSTERAIAQTGPQIYAEEIRRGKSLGLKAPVDKNARRRFLYAMRNGSRPKKKRTEKKEYWTPEVPSDEDDDFVPTYTTYVIDGQEVIMDLELKGRVFTYNEPRIYKDQVIVRYEKLYVTLAEVIFKREDLDRGIRNQVFYRNLNYLDLRAKNLVFFTDKLEFASYKRAMLGTTEPRKITQIVGGNFRVYISKGKYKYFKNRADAEAFVEEDRKKRMDLIKEKEYPIPTLPPNPLMY